MPLLLSCSISLTKGSLIVLGLTVLWSMGEIMSVIDKWDMDCSAQWGEKSVWWFVFYSIVWNFPLMRNSLNPNFPVLFGKVTFTILLFEPCLCLASQYSLSFLNSRKSFSYIVASYFITLVHRHLLDISGMFLLLYQQKDTNKLIVSQGFLQ